jgi:hypothetical protein
LNMALTSLALLSSSELRPSLKKPAFGILHTTPEPPGRQVYRDPRLVGSIPQTMKLLPSQNPRPLVVHFESHPTRLMSGEAFGTFPHTLVIPTVFAAERRRIPGSLSFSFSCSTSNFRLDV